MRNARERILDCAERLVTRDGVAHLTLDAVAAEAGISKGGVLYHFASKDALVGAMVERLVARFDAALATETARDADPHGRFARAYRRATFPTDGAGSDARVSAAILAAAGNDPRLLQPLRDRYTAWQQQRGNEVDPAATLAVQLAVDGLWMWELFGFPTPAADLKARVFELLDAWTRNV